MFLVACENSSLSCILAHDALRVVDAGSDGKESWGIVQIVRFEIQLMGEYLG